jgi:hypothetical protein
MGIIKRGILGGFSGKVANVVGTNWKGIEVIKAMPLSVRNPKTVSQVAQRTLFLRAIIFAQSIGVDVCRFYNNRTSVRKSGFNAVTSRFINYVKEHGSLSGFHTAISVGNATVYPNSATGIWGWVTLGQLVFEKLLWEDRVARMDAGIIDYFVSNNDGSVVLKIASGLDMSVQNSVALPVVPGVIWKYAWVVASDVESGLVSKSHQISI